MEIKHKRYAKLVRLQRLLKIKFKDFFLINLAFSHSSYVNESKKAEESNEKLEFLGDSVLALIVNDYLFKNTNNKNEGELSKIKSIVVSETILAKIAKEIDLGPFLLMGKGEKKSGGAERPAVLADTLEALLGALYLDRGLKVTRKFILPYIINEIEEVIENKNQLDFKTELQLYTQQKFKICPLYKTVKEEGPDHRKIFYVHVFLEEKLIGQGQGSNKKSAQQEAAKSALEYYENENAKQKPKLIKLAK